MNITHPIRFAAHRRDFHSLRELLAMHGIEAAIYEDQPGYDDTQQHLAIVLGDHGDNAKAQRLIDHWAI